MFPKSLLLVPVLLLAACGGNLQNGSPRHGEHSGAEQEKAYLADRERESARLSDGDLQHMVDRLFIEADPGRKNFHGLLFAGYRPVPFLVQALAEQRTWTTVFFHDGFHLTGNSPFERICGLLRETVPAEAARPLARFLDHPDPGFRKLASGLLAAIASSECLEPVKKSLASHDPGLRERTLLGLLQGAKSEHREEAFVRGVFPAVLPLLDTGEYDTEGPPEVLAALDAAKAVPILESPKYFTASNPQLRHILKALDRDDVKVPRNNVMNLLAVLELLAERQPAHQWDYAAALILYARNPDAAAENRFRILTGSPSVPIAEAAAQGLEILAGISSQAAAAAAFHERGYARMTRSQQVYHAIAEYRDEVNNGGHDQFFRNSSGELCDTVIEGLRLVGSPSKAAILSGARGAFAPFPPAKGQEERCNQMEAFGPRQIEILRTADKSFGYSEQRPGERLTVLLTLYALQHKRDFATPRSAPKAAAPPAAR